MLKAVYFDDALCDQLPQPYRLSYFYAYPDNRGITLPEIIDSIQSGVEVNIRHATASELKRAEMYNASFEIGKALFASQAGLLDQEPPEVVTGRANQLREALGTLDRPVEILDREPGTAAPFPDAPPLPDYTNERKNHDEPTNGRLARIILGTSAAFARFRNAVTGATPRAVSADDGTGRAG